MKHVISRDLLSGKDATGGGRRHAHQRRLYSQLTLRLLQLAVLLLALFSGQASAQITRIGEAWAPSSGNSASVSTPAGTAADDVMLAFVSVRGSGRTIDVPAGWTAVAGLDTAAGDLSQRVFYRVATAAEPATHTFTWSGNDLAVAAIVSYRNVNTSAPIDAAGAQGGTSDASITAPSITTSVAGTLLVGIFGGARSGLSFTAPGSMAAIAFAGGPNPDSSRGNNGVTAIVAEELFAGTGATGARTTTSDRSVDNIGQILALRPASGFLVEAAGGGAIPDEIAGTSFDIRITALTPGGAVNTAFNGTVTISSTGSLSAGAGVTAAFVNGVLAAHTVRISNGGTFNITATATAGTATGVSNDFLVAPKLQVLVPGETADPGSPTGKLGTPLTQTQGVPFNVTVNAVDEFWNLVPGAADTVTITSSDPAAVLPPGAALAGGTGVFAVILNTPPSATLTANATAPARVDTSPPVPIATVGGTFNACDVAAICTAGTPSTFIRTKIAGAAFNLDVVALNASGVLDTSYNKTVRIELVDASDNSGALDSDNCRATWSTIATLAPDPVFSNAGNGRITVGPFNVPNAYRNVRVRIVSQNGPDRRGCSTDSFAIRPAAFANFAAGDNDWQTAGTGRTLDSVAFTALTHKAGRPFSLRASAVNAAAAPIVTTNYAGTPTAHVTVCAGAACTASTGTLTLTVAFAAGQLVTDTVSYDEVGSFRLQLIDDTFAAVDNGDGSTLAERRVQSPAIDVGRFVPDHFDVALNAPTFTTGCAGGNFTYVGQTFGYGTAPVITVLARNAAGGTTALYAGAWWRVNNASLGGKTYASASGVLDTSGMPATDPVIAAAGLGTGTLTFGSGSGFRFSRGARTPPFNAEVSLAIDVADADGVAYTANPARFGNAVAGGGIAFTSGKQMRFGQLRATSANGSNLLPLRMALEARYWLEPAPGKGYFVTNTADSCTVITAANVGIGNFRGGLASGDTAASVAAGALSGGLKTLVLAAPGGAKTGSVDVVLNLAAGAGSIHPCSAFDAPLPTPAAAGLAYLRGQWCGAAADRDPVARARFGAYRGAETFIDLRESF